MQSTSFTSIESAKSPRHSWKNFALRFATAKLCALHDWVIQVRKSWKLDANSMGVVCDLLNCGPRHRFATPGSIASNCLAWRAGETDFLDLCRRGISPYVAHGLMTGRVEDAAVFEKERKVKGSDAAHTYSGLKAEVLLLGYGGGAETFLRSAKVYGINFEAGSREQESCEITVSMDTGVSVREYTRTVVDSPLAQAHRVVTAFREGRPKVVGLWRELERDWRMAYSCGHNPILLPLPSGRHLRYFNPRVAEREAHARTSLDARLPSKIYGGLLTENWVQASARDVLADMLLRLSRYDWLTPLMTVHDEILFEVDEHRADEGLAVVKKEMSTPPAWAPDLPVDCDSALLDCYTK